MWRINKPHVNRALQFHLSGFIYTEQHGLRRRQGQAYGSHQTDSLKIYKGRQDLYQQGLVFLPRTSHLNRQPVAGCVELPCARTGRTDTTPVYSRIAFSGLWQSLHFLSPIPFQLKFIKLNIDIFIFIHDDFCLKFCLISLWRHLGNKQDCFPRDTNSVATNTQFEQYCNCKGFPHWTIGSITIVLPHPLIDCDRTEIYFDEDLQHCHFN